jgi:hypothetical protein
MSERMEWEGGPVLGVKHIIQERLVREEQLMAILSRYPYGVPRVWDNDQVVEKLKQMEAEGGIVFSSWTV